MDSLTIFTTWIVSCCLVTVLDAGVGPKFINSPEPIVAPMHDEVEFECSLDVPAEQIRWKHNRKMLPHHFNNSSRSQLIFRVEQPSQVGEYQCVAWYGASALASTPARLSLATLGPPPPPSSTKLIVSAGNNIVINCSVPFSNPPAGIQYYKNNITLQGGQILGSGALMLTSIEQADSGQYSCSATNTYVQGSPLFIPIYNNLNVVTRSEQRPPRFAYLPPDKYVVQPGANITLECVAFGEPVPKASWRRRDGLLRREKAQQTAVGLRIINIQQSDEGSYICEMSNGIPQNLIHQISLFVQEPPNITRRPDDQRVKEGGKAVLECSVRGKPTPSIHWLLNGNFVNNDSHVRVYGGKLELSGVEKRHAGWYQCMAQNELGATSAACQLLVVPRQVMVNTTIEPPETSFKHNPQTHRKKHHKAKSKSAKEMTPPSKPVVTRLSDTSVMVRWHVPPNAGLPILFFKVQHRELSRKGSDWMTNNEDIPPHVGSYEVTNLNPDSYYRFRIAAVYSNQDNKLSQNSAKFHLHSSKSTRPPAAPRLSHMSPAGSEAIKIFWEFNKSEPTVEGFYVYYRSTSSAGDYVKATVEGDEARSYVITHLQPDTAYDFKLQSFTVDAASEFSEILTQKTERCSTVSPPITESTPSSVESESDGISRGGHQLYVTLGAVLGGLALLLVLCTLIFCCNKHRQHHSTNTDDDDVDKSRHIQMEAIHVNGHVAGHVSGSRSNDVIVSKTNSNGCCSKMNITSNPLDPEESKTQNVMEIAFITTNSCDDNCSSSVLTARLASAAVLPTCAMESESWRRPELPRTVDNYV